MKQFIKEQWYWFRKFFEETSREPDKPSHKNLAVLALVGVFIIAYMRVLAATNANELPDIPDHWLVFLLGALGIRAVQSVFEKRMQKNSQNPLPPSPPK